ncbi:MAG: CHASE4 domain-containing protein, partial [Methanobacterium sp.]
MKRIFLKSKVCATMKLREKTLVLLGITITCSIIVMYMASNVVLMGGFQTLEEQNTLQNIQLATNVLSGEISDLNKTINDWAVWDDTYIFIQNHNSRYIQSNLLNSTFTDLKLNLVIYFDNSGNIVYGKEFDLQKKEEKPVSESIKKYISKDNILLSSQDGVKGIIMLPEGPMIIDSHPILTSNGDGPSRGTLIFGRYLNDVEIQHLSGKIQSSLTLVSYNDSNMPADFQTARDSMSQ